MVLLETAESAADVAAVLAQKLPENLSRTAVTLFKALVATAIETGKRRGYSPGTTHVTMHLPLEVLADVCRMHRVTAWRHLPALRELGLIDYRAHKGTLRGETRNTGTLFQVRLNPTAGSKARLSYDDLKHKWRDLDRDVRCKRTAHRQLRDTVQQSKGPSIGELDISRLLAWTLPPQLTKPPLKVFSDSCTARQPSLESLLDVKYADRGERGHMVDMAAQALSQALSDHAGINFYRRLLWQLLRRFDATGDDHGYSLYMMATRARTDASEGFARKPGALFTSRVKAAPWWFDVWAAPTMCVGTPPLKS